MTSVDLRQAPAADVVQALDRQSDLTRVELQAALANALDRIASLEHDRDGLEQIIKAFNAMIKASRLHGPGILNQQ